jgi:hypothetical protein
MTKEEWLTNKYQSELLNLVRDKASERKLRLFACAVTRREWQWLIRKRNRTAVEVAERFADGLATREELKKAADGAFDNLDSWGKRYDTLRNANITYAVEKSWMVSHYEAWDAANHVTGPAISAVQCDMIRCIFGNPFRSIGLDPAHRPPTVVSLARAAYDERELPSGELDPLRLAVLADALEETGAPDELVTHLRGPGPHVRGCFAIDLCLGLS